MGLRNVFRGFGLVSMAGRILMIVKSAAENFEWVAERGH